MVTKNFKAMMAMALESGGGSQYGASRCCMPVRDVYGVRGYHSRQISFPAGVTATATLNAATAGISVGRGSRTPDEDDYNLEDTVTAGIQVSVQSVEDGCDPPCDPYVLYRLAVTNTGTEPVTIREVGFKQSLYGQNKPGPSSSSGAMVCLLDRTVLASPVTIQPGDAGAVNYKLKTRPAPHRSVDGVELVSWTWGTGAQIAALIAAARRGAVDLQRDAGWRIGDVRRVEIGAFNSPTVSHTAQTAYLVISSFAEYEGCGNVLQFDFLENLAKSDRMNSANTNAGGYGASELYADTLPALAAALPDWLRGLLLPFSVKASAGQKSAVIETVTGNYLAPRSETEVYGTSSYAVPGEGEWVALYQGAEKYRYKSSNNYTWLRGPYKSSNTGFCVMNSTRGPAYTNANGIGYLAPFGCI